MENASKALIIAGAILISILLISLGILIYNQASNITSGDQMSEMEITSFNQKFLQYEGTKNGSQIKSLIQQVISSNSNAENETRKITVNNGKTVASDPKNSGDIPITGSGTSFDVSKVKNNTRYSVGFSYGDGSDGHNNGIIYDIQITVK